MSFSDQNNVSKEQFFLKTIYTVKCVNKKMELTGRSFMKDKKECPTLHESSKQSRY